MVSNWRSYVVDVVGAGIRAWIAAVGDAVGGVERINCGWYYNFTAVCKSVCGCHAAGSKAVHDRPKYLL